MTREFMFSSLLLCALAISPSYIFAGFQIFTQRSAFEAAYQASGGIADELDFDSMPIGVVNDGETLNGITFNYNLPNSVRLKIASGFATTSGSNYLGTDDGDLFQSGDEFAMSFSARIGIGLYVISNDPLIDGDIVLNFGGQEVALFSNDVEATLTDGQVWFLGVLSDVPFTNATLTSPGTPTFFFNADNVVTIVATPEPSTLMLFPAIGLLGVGYRKWRKQAHISNLEVL